MFSEKKSIKGFYTVLQIHVFVHVNPLAGILLVSENRSNKEYQTLGETVKQMVDVEVGCGRVEGEG